MGGVRGCGVCNMEVHSSPCAWLSCSERSGEGVGWSDVPVAAAARGDDWGDECREPRWQQTREQAHVSRQDTRRLRWDEIMPNGV